MTSALGCLHRARNWLKDPAHWCIGALARSAAGYTVAPGDERCVETDAEGAVIRAAKGAEELGLCLDLIRRAAADMGFDSVGLLNDEGDHATVLRLLDRSIEMARKVAA